MRFEIGPGGMFLILLGLAGLSGAVFSLGLVAGHEMAGPEPGSQPVAAAYPLPPSAPASMPPEPAEASAPAPASPNTAAASSSETAGTVGTTAASNPPSKPAVASAAAVKAPASAPVVGVSTTRRTATNAVAARAPRTNPAPAADEDLSTGAAVAPPSESASAPAETADTGTDEGDEETAPAAAPVEPPRRKLAAVNSPAGHAASGQYSVQIDAMMDRAGAQQMAQKIRAKGFEPYIVPTLVGGKTWYRLRVGHYATPEQAQAAESRLHQEFNDTPAGN